MLLATAALFAAGRLGFGQTPQYVQDFDAVTAPNLPPGWSAPESAWETSASVPSPGSGGNNVEIKGVDTGSLVSPVFDLTSATLVELQYSARRTATFDSLNLSVEASVDGGLTWTIVLLDSTQSLPAPPSTYVTVGAPLPAALIGEASVRFRFRARNKTGGNLRIDDVEVLADGSVLWNRFGFRQATSQAVEKTDSLVIPIGIYLIPSSDSLQGLQFTLTFTPGVSFRSLEPGIAALRSPGWHLAHEATDSTVAVVLLVEGASGLAPQSTDSLLLVSVRTLPLDGETLRNDAVTIESVVASTATATGEDLFLTVEPAVHTIEIAPASPRLAIDSLHVHAGTIRQDSSTVLSIRLTNVGTDVLQVFDMFSLTGLLGIDPTFAVLSPDSSADVALTVAGRAYGVGPLEDRLVIEHNGSTSPDSVAITGLVISTDARGDANDDGYVDVVDLVIGIDLILNRVDLPGTGLRLDLYPFPSGDGVVDVRDLTVLARAIAGGIWPDGAALPVPPAAAAKGSSVVGDLIVKETDDGIKLFVRSTEPLRALHVVGLASGKDWVITPDAALPFFQIGVPYKVLGAGSFSILTFGIDVVPIPAGRRVLIATMEGVEARDVEITSAVAVDGATVRRRLLVVEETGALLPGGDEIYFDAPYPNPVLGVRTALVHLPFRAGSNHPVKIIVSDVLGRTVRSWDDVVEAGRHVAVWDMRNNAGPVVPAGLYFITAIFDGRRLRHSLMIR